MPQKFFATRTELAVKAASEAGNLLQAKHGKIHTLTWKERDDFKTKVDDASEKLIVGLIHKHFPCDSVVAEEGTNVRGVSTATWYVDPLDGTKEYVLGFSNYFAVSIGVAFEADPEPCSIGAIHIPLRNEIYYNNDHSALCNGIQIHVLKPHTFSHAIVTVQSGKAKSTKLKALALQEHLTGEVAMIPRIGSAAVCLALLASGKLHGYIGFGLEPWDLAGGVALIKSAGGKTTTPEGKEWQCGDDSLVAAHPDFHQKLLDFLSH